MESSIPAIGQVDENSRNKVPVLLGFPTTGRQDFEVDKSNLARLAKMSLPDYLRRATTPKKERITPTHCLPDTDELNQEKGSALDFRERRAVDRDLDGTS